MGTPTLTKLSIKPGQNYQLEPSAVRRLAGQPSTVTVSVAPALELPSTPPYLALSLPIAFLIVLPILILLYLLTTRKSRVAPTTAVNCKTTTVERKSSRRWSKWRYSTYQA